MDACRVILIGMMGSGKSTIGGLLSEVTGWPYVDNDELVLRAQGAMARQLLAEQGEAVMRAAESSALALGLGVPEPAIVGLAAGTILDPSNRELLRGGGIVVYLRADAETLASRAMGAEHRPWIDTGGDAWFQEALEQRDTLYASVADIVVDTKLDTPPEAAAGILDRLRAFEACKDRLLSPIEPRAPRT